LIYDQVILLINAIGRN